MDICSACGVRVPPANAFLHVLRCTAATGRSAAPATSTVIADNSREMQHRMPHISAQQDHDHTVNAPSEPSLKDLSSTAVCPLCNARLPADQIDDHVNACLDSTETQEASVMGLDNVNEIQRSNSVSSPIMLDEDDEHEPSVSVTAMSTVLPPSASGPGTTTGKRARPSSLASADTVSHQSAPTVLAPTASIAAVPSTNSRLLSVVSWNIDGLSEGDATARARYVATHLMQLQPQPQIILLQEITRATLPVLLTNLGKRYQLIGDVPSQPVTFVCTQELSICLRI